MAKEKKYKVKQKREECIGCGACISICPENWKMEKDGKAKPKKTAITEKEYRCNKEAADVCPVNIIEIEEA